MKQKMTEKEHRERHQRIKQLERAYDRAHRAYMNGSPMQRRELRTKILDIVGQLSETRFGYRPFSKR